MKRITAVHCYVARSRNQLYHRQIETVVFTRGLNIGTMGTWDNAKCSAAFVRASNRETDREAVTVVGVLSLSAVLMPREIRKTAFDIERLDQTLGAQPTSPLGAAAEVVSCDIGEP